MCIINQCQFSWKNALYCEHMFHIICYQSCILVTHIVTNTYVFKNQPGLSTVIHMKFCAWLWTLYFYWNMSSGVFKPLVLFILSWMLLISSVVCLWIILFCQQICSLSNFVIDCSKRLKFAWVYTRSMYRNLVFSFSKCRCIGNLIKRFFI